MAQDEGEIVTPREYDYWRPIYRELALLPDWSELSTRERAQKLLDRINEKLLEADTLAQRKALFACIPEEKLKTARNMIEYFESEDES
jgi:hypothetical protein